MENTTEKPSGNKATIVKNTAQLSKIPRQIITQQASSAKKEQEEELQQANAENTAENTAEKPSGNKATIVKNTAQLSKIPRQIITQQAENTTATWPIIPTALIWYITTITSQEEDLLRRSQSIRPLQEGHRTIHIWTN
ncbi:hypothetical protein HO173_001722 [Letharia columbiana]|uniref:Uncharacterized protein n=1 Tax=Letharia columbiana TaxID=112416 RepID=A0A8H6G460_9LECA|nr:uncharacterized protein HO173_001722 [Letharia columbiana]KAF6240112.1 hypothetical protein HO173_001722 [Letharia columbiana]